MSFLLQVNKLVNLVTSTRSAQSVVILGFGALLQLSFGFVTIQPRFSHPMGLYHAKASYFTTSNGLDVRLSRFCLKMSSYPTDDIFLPLKIISNQPEAEDIRLIKAQVPNEVFFAYKIPGQFVKIKAKGPDSKPAFFAIASPPAKIPSDNTFTFLIKDVPNNEFLTKAALNQDILEVSVPLGNGFAIEEYFDKYKNDFPTNNILMFATGTGIAPIAATIDSALLKLQLTQYTSLFARKAKLYLGVRTPKHLPLRSKLDEWKRIGVEIIPVMSKKEESVALGWNGRFGYVQDVFKEDGVKVPRNSGVLLCGQKAMTTTVKELCLEAGVFEGRILFNF